MFAPSARRLLLAVALAASWAAARAEYLTDCADRAAQPRRAVGLPEEESLGERPAPAAETMSTFGTLFRVTTYGESHCKGVG